MTISKSAEKIQNYIFSAVVAVSYILYFAIAFGLSVKAPEYLETLQYLAKLYVGLFLVIRFNMFRKIHFTDLDRKIAFSAGIFILTTTFVNQIITYYITKITKYKI
jgi:hypothetical protein